MLDRVKGLGSGRVKLRIWRCRLTKKHLDFPNRPEQGNLSEVKLMRVSTPGLVSLWLARS